VRELPQSWIDRPWAPLELGEVERDLIGWTLWAVALVTALVVVAAVIALW
jgi:hypothetical protein